MNQADMDLVATVEAHIAAKDARIAELEKALRTAENALSRCYDVTEWPAQRGSEQLDALGDVRKALGL